VSAANWLQLGVLVGAVFVTTPLLGSYLARVLGGGAAPGDRVFLPAEQAIYRVAGVDPDREQRWNVYALSLLAFSLVSAVGLYALQRVQGGLPLNPTDVEGVPPALAFNTAVSVVTNTNWQNYGGESTMSHLTQSTSASSRRRPRPRARCRRRTSCARRSSRRSRTTCALRSRRSRPRSPACSSATWTGRRRRGTSSS
jgi:K+-transporting ATPase A subunit